MLIFFLILLFLISCLFIYASLTKKMVNLQRQILLITRQNTELKNKLNEKTLSFDNLTIKYKNPINNSGIINEECILYLFPLENSKALLRLNKDTNVSVQDSAEISGTLWYQVAPLYEHEASEKGWVKENFIQLIINNE